MFDQTFTSIFPTVEGLQGTLTSGDFLLCSLASLILGAIVALVYMFRHDYSRNFVLTLAVLPLVVQTVITLVNGNIGAGIAVMGVFNLVRFRSIPGSAKDIGSVFFAMAIGLATGMGYLVLAVVFAVIVSVANILYVMSPFGTKTHDTTKLLKITIPEDLDYCGVFDDVFERFTSLSQLLEVRTTNMGSLFQLQYEVRLKDTNEEKSFIDELRCRNGNLQITLGRMIPAKEVL